MAANRKKLEIKVQSYQQKGHLSWIFLSYIAPAAFFPAYDKSKLPTTPPAMAPTTVPMPGATEPAACGENIVKIIDQTHHNTHNPQ